MIVKITATFECDDCGTLFDVPIDPARKPPHDWCLLEIAEDAIRGQSLISLGSVDPPNHFCPSCTEIRDQE